MPKFNQKLLKQIPRAYLRKTEKKKILIALDIKKNELQVSPEDINITLVAGTSEIQWQAKNAPLSIRFLGATPFLTNSFPCAAAASCLSGVPIKGLVRPGVYEYLVEVKYVTPNKNKSRLLTVAVPSIRLRVTVQ